jgi:repressor LexA
MDSMAQLTKTQESIRAFIGKEMAAGRLCPSRREIAEHFNFKSHNAANSHIEALLRKGVLVVDAGKARSLRLAEDARPIQPPTFVDIPLFGSIPAGFAEEREQAVDEWIRVDVATINYRPTPKTFALQAAGDSMIGRHICSGDVVICERDREPRNNDIVVAMIDGKTTLKTFIQKGRKTYLKAENPKYPDMIPSEELVIQGVYCALIRRAKA